jgi:GlpG protein
MRVIGTISNEMQARRFSAFLKRNKIDNSCEMNFDAATGAMSYPIWVHEEDAMAKAMVAFERFQKNPADPEFDVPILEQVEPKEVMAAAPAEEMVMTHRVHGRVTMFFLSLCALVFFLNMVQEIPLREEGMSEKTFLMTPIQSLLLYDVPPAIEALESVAQKYKIGPNQKIEQLSPELKAELEAVENMPFWRGIYDWVLLKVKGEDTALSEGPLFVKIRQGEVWRLFSPCVLHRDFLHILFNMIWLWVLGRPIEQRIGATRTVVLTVASGIVSNTAQYLMSGPFFLGYSGIVMGLAGFIWMRQKLAPWEGYPLHRSTILFLLFFIGAMFALQLGSFFLSVASSIQFNPSIANTAHLAGAFVGILLARMPWFNARVQA